jgi:hypothetical protein
MGCGLRTGVSIPGKGQKFALLRSVQTVFEAHVISYPMGVGVLFLKVNWLVREADHSPPSSAEVKNGGAIPPPALISSCLMLN